MRPLRSPDALAALATTLASFATGCTGELPASARWTTASALPSSAALADAAEHTSIERFKVAIALLREHRITADSGGADNARRARECVSMTPMSSPRVARDCTTRRRITAWAVS
jgi:hypothetical protein